MALVDVAEGANEEAEEVVVKSLGHSNVENPLIKHFVFKVKAF